MALKTVLNKIIVEPVEAETKTASGIIIPDSAKEKPQKGIVVATGTFVFQSLTCIYIKRHMTPAPIINKHFQRHVSLHVGIRGNILFL